MTYTETQDYLFALRSLGSKFGLERMRTLYERAGNPGAGVPIIHVAGTNGKGSVCAMLEAVARANGCRTGLFTSPHLLRLGERVQVNRQPLSEAQIVDYVRALRPLCEQIAGGDPQGHPTFFELMTVIALRHFEREGCDVILLETGLGGRLDSTNVVHPAVTIITSIGLDHQEILGETLEAIAAEKAGIIKRGIPLVLGKLPEQARRVVLEKAAVENVSVLEAQAYFEPASLAVSASKTAAEPLPPQLRAAGNAASVDLDGTACGSGRIHLRPYPQTSLAGTFQRRNAAVALLAYEQLHAVCPQIRYDAQASLAALRSVHWAGRWQSIHLSDGDELILDSSHNEEGAGALEENLARFVQEHGVKPIVVTGALGAGRAAALLAVIARYAATIFLVKVAQPRACSLEQMQAAIPPSFEGKVFTATVEGLFCAGQGRGGELAACATDEPVLVTGSIYLIGEVLTRLHGETSAEAVHLQDKLPQTDKETHSG